MNIALHLPALQVVIPLVSAPLAARTHTRLAVITKMATIVCTG